MSIYDNETKIFKDLNPTAPQESQTYRLNKLNEIEAYFLNEVEVFYCCTAIQNKTLR